MPRIRTIKPSFFRSEDVGRLSYRARLTWIGIWLHADDHGRYVFDPRVTKADLWLFEDAVTIGDVETDLNELLEHGHISRYEVDDKSYLEVVNFRKHQVINKPSAGHHPAPLTEHSGSTTGTRTEASAPEEEEEKEVGSRKKEREAPSRFCIRHPNGSDGIACGGCRDARIAREEWDSKTEAPPSLMLPPRHDPDPANCDHKILAGVCVRCGYREGREDVA